ncbi:MAG: hypothetical protein JNG84_01600 [Archangium sp.]|nr:hypothetical protein [Archangium sp.]
MTTPVRISDFVKASRTHLEKSLKKANVDGNATLSAKEAKTLPKDLKDSFAEATRTGVKVKNLARDYAAFVADAARRADANGDGVLSAADAKRLPKALQDNFKNYAASLEPKLNVKDKTPATRITQHVSAYGAGRVAYASALTKGIAAVMKDRTTGPGAVLKENGDGDGNTLTNAQIDAELKKAFKAVTLLKVGEAEDSGFDPETQWIFAVDCSVGSDHGFWVAVDRKTGATEVTSFN